MTFLWEIGKSREIFIPKTIKSTNRYDFFREKLEICWKVFISKSLKKVFNYMLYLLDKSKIVRYYNSDLGESSLDHRRREEFPAIFLLEVQMKALSIFIDESGDFGEIKERPAYYLVTMIFSD